MDLSSWFRRNLLKNKKSNRDTEEEQSKILLGPADENLGLTEDLIIFCKSLTVDTFRTFTLPVDDCGNDSRTSSNVRKDLSEWQEQHATLVLSKVKEISHLRYMLCPRHLKEQEFWRIYFNLVNNHVAEYELRSIREAKLRSMAMGNEKPLNATAYEVEMAETKPVTGLM